MENSEIPAIIKSLNQLLRSEITLDTLNEEFEKISKRMQTVGLKIKAIEATRLFAFFEFENGVIVAHLYNKINHKLIRNLVEKYNISNDKL